MSKVKFNVDNKKVKQQTKEMGTFCVVTFHPKLNVLQNITNKLLYLLHMNDEVKRVFPPKPMVSFRSSRQITSYVVRKNVSY